MTLQTTARVMRYQIDLQAKGWVRRDLPRGLQVVLSHDSEDYRLAIGREGTYPSAEEIAVCARTFGVPDGSDHRLFKYAVQHPKTGRKIRIYAAEFTWRELPAATERAMRAA